MKISEIITDKYKLRIPPTIYYELLADVVEAEDEQEPQSFKWCRDCREYDQENHCCHRWSKVIRDTVEEMKQEYIEREVLDKIRAEIIQVVAEENAEDSRWALGLKYSIKIIDKYKAETEDT